MKLHTKLSPIVTFNPELQRNIWLELSFGRMLGMALVITILGGGVYELWGDRYASGVLISVLWVLVIIWGPLLAADSVFDEIQSRTWDVQRLSGQRAVSLVLGKLTGSTIYVWYGALLCGAAVFRLAPDQMHKIYDNVLIGIMAQSMAMLTALVIMRFGSMGSRRVGRLAAWIGGVSFAAIFSVLIERMKANTDFADQSMTHWYGMSFSGVKFWYVFEVLMILWIVFGMIRLMRRELGYCDGPLGWTLFVAYIMIFVSGLQMNEIGSAWFSTDTTFAIAKSWQSHAFLSAHALTYVALLCLPIAAATSRKIALAVSHKQWAVAWTETPAWIPAFGLTLLGALLFATTGLGHAISTIALLGFFCRDIIIVYGFRTRFMRRSETALIIYFALIYLFASFVITLGYQSVSGVTQGLLLEAFSPPVENGPSIGIIFPWVEALLAYLMFRKNFTKLYRPLTDDRSPY